MYNEQGTGPAAEADKCTNHIPNPFICDSEQRGNIGTRGGYGGHAHSVRRHLIEIPMESPENCVIKTPR